MSRTDHILTLTEVIAAVSSAELRARGTAALKALVESSLDVSSELGATSRKSPGAARTRKWRAKRVGGDVTPDVTVTSPTTSQRPSPSSPDASPVTPKTSPGDVASPSSLSPLASPLSLLPDSTAAAEARAKAGLGSPLAETILVELRRWPKLAAAADVEMANTLALVAERAKVPHLVAKAIAEAAADVVASGLIEDVAIRKRVTSFVGNVKPSRDASHGASPVTSPASPNSRRGPPPKQSVPSDLEERGWGREEA